MLKLLPFILQINILLQMFVLGGVGFVLASLTGAFWAYFMYLWKTWDNGKRDTNSGPGNYPSTEEEREKEQQLHLSSRDDLTGSDDISLPEVNQVKRPFKMTSNKLPLTLPLSPKNGYFIYTYISERLFLGI